ncbi:NADH-ubiquinone oxidoreductase-F iron-sulfur binding region domain-containing protein [Aeromicrobium sp. A1-2]|uniref:NADH-ubiquinone oxidoreductase-F iron-sulfur binding region domain-containing protein n=1 Tax=Aeromicrobium sp. A1-2 TaxID=2107713 RepID=UPI0013C37A2F|nr:NADH-ubiquinone oxidoreductase-F iron-sulfur binding region domain-containing protein [Aeromicrobium sp. A1-2]
MTVIAIHPDVAANPGIHVIGTPRLLAGVIELGRVDHRHHLALHGAPPFRRRIWLSDAMREVNLLGRGGAGFPVSTKLDAMPGRAHATVLVNGSESEPASHKDRVLMTHAPHLVIDGALVMAHALGSRHIVITVHDPGAADSLTAACLERTDADDVQVVRTSDSFVGGEIRAVINGLGGKPAVPSGRKVLPHVHGVDGRSTFASNVETFAHIALLARLGVAEYASVGATTEPGTSLLTVIGDVPHAGVVEVPNGMPLEVLLPGPWTPVLVGGYHGTWVADLAGLAVDRGALRGAGSPLGAGVIARPHPGTCIVEEVVRVARWLAAESAGQCGPCFFGLPALADDLAAIAAGAGSARVAGAHRRLDLVRGRGACAHPDGSAQFIGSALDALAPELAIHALHGRCGLPASDVLPLPGGIS